MASFRNIYKYKSRSWILKGVSHFRKIWWDISWSPFWLQLTWCLFPRFNLVSNRFLNLSTDESYGMTHTVSKKAMQSKFNNDVLYHKLWIDSCNIDFRPLLFARKWPTSLPGRNDIEPKGIDVAGKAPAEADSASIAARNWVLIYKVNN